MKNPIKSIIHTYDKLSNWGKILIFVVLLLCLVVLFQSLPNSSSAKKEGFEKNDHFKNKNSEDLYDNFYVDIYDDLVYNTLKDDYEIGSIVNKTTPTSESIMLDVGCGTGHHVGKLTEQGLNVTGIDKSESMIQKAKTNYPNSNFIQGNIMDLQQFKNNSFTHILCLYFTIYYFQNKQAFFNNCMEWLMPGGYLVIHLVNRDHFDPILPVANPLYIVSPQKYAKERITSSKVTFDDFIYNANFELDKTNNIGKFREKFKFKNNGKVRTKEHIFYMESQNHILSRAQNAGFIIGGKIDLVKCAYENQYLYILVKPE